MSARRPRQLRTSVAVIGMLVCGLGLLILVDRMFSVRAEPEATHGSGMSRELEAALDRHGLALPSDATNIEYTLSVSIDSDKVGLRFDASEHGVTDFLASLGAEPGDLRTGENPWALSFSESPELYGWKLDWASGLKSYVAREPRPGEHWYAVAIDESGAVPVVYIQGVRL